jgi:hypothetical protein
MKALVISGRQDKVDQGSGDSASFDEIVASGVGPSYIISDKEQEQLTPGSKVVILDKDRGRRSESRLRELRPTERADNGKQRYDVCFEIPVTPVNYRNERLNHNGVAIIDLT